MKSLIKSEVRRTMDSLSKQLNALNQSPSPRDSKTTKIKPNAMFRINNDINKLHSWFFGDIDKRPNHDNITKATKKIVNCDNNLFLILIQCIKHLEFNTAKQSANIIKYIITNCKNNKSHHYIKLLTDIHHYNPIIQSLIYQYNHNCSDILHEMVKQRELTAMFVTLKVDCPSEGIEDNTRSFTFVDVMLMLTQSPDLVISSSASQTLGVLLGSNDDSVCGYLERNFKELFDKINNILMHCDNFVVKKRLIRLVHDIITKKKQNEILRKYIQNKEYLVVVMDAMLKYKNKGISFEAWHVFKLFVANKYKQKDIHFVLWKNKGELIKFLSSFDLCKGNESFVLEKQFVMRCLEDYNG